MAQPAPRLSALVLSDNTEAVLVNRVLESHGFRVERAQNAKAAETLCRGERFDLAVYDHSVSGAMELAGPRCPTSRPRVTVGILPAAGTAESVSRRLHFVVRKPFSSDFFARTVKAAYGPIAADRRVSFRHQARIAVSSCTVDHHGERRSISGAQIVNISQTGMCLQTQEMLPQNAGLELGFAVPQRSIGLQVRGTVMWAHASGRAGVKFAQLKPADQRNLEDWLDSLLPNPEMFLKAGEARAILSH
ncbi:MAG TPA: PilZ domain-containing protein [Terriglobales bacterium]|nr:PilZ domain-containing protein [Terriglobales bacterium]